MFLGCVLGIWIHLMLVNKVTYPLSPLLGLVVFIIFSLFHTHDHVGLLDVDAIAMRSKIGNRDPLLKLGFIFSTILICLISGNVFVCTFVIISMSFLTLIIGSLKVKYYINILKLPLVFIALSSIGIMVQISGKKLGYYDVTIFSYILSITKESQNSSMQLFFKAYAGLTSIYFLGITTPMGDIISGLRRIYLPEILIELMYLIYRYIMLVFDTFTNLNRTAAARFGYGKLLLTLSTSKAVAVRLMNYSFRQALDNYDAMESRLYDGRLIFLENNKVITPKDLVFTVSYILFLFLLIIVGRII